MNNLTLHSIKLSSGVSAPSDWENFDEFVDVTFAVKDGFGSSDEHGYGAKIVFQLRVVSVTAVKSDSAKFLQNCVVQRYFGLPELDVHIKKLMKRVQFLSLAEEVEKLSLFLTLKSR